MLYVPSREIVLPGERCRRCGKPIRRPEFPLRRPRVPRRQRAPLRLSGDNVQVNSSDAVNISAGHALNVGGAGDACCCACVGCTGSATPVSWTLTWTGATPSCVPRVGSTAGSAPDHGFFVTPATLAGLSFTLSPASVPTGITAVAASCYYQYVESPATSFSYTVYNPGTHFNCTDGVASVTLDLFVFARIDSVGTGVDWEVLMYLTGQYPGGSDPGHEGEFATLHAGSHAWTIGGHCTDSFTSGAVALTPNF